jgi:hypothetical protein
MGCIQVLKEAGDGMGQCCSKEQKIAALSSRKTVSRKIRTGKSSDLPKNRFLIESSLCL